MVKLLIGTMMDLSVSASEADLEPVPVLSADASQAGEAVLGDAVPHHRVRWCHGGEVSRSRVAARRVRGRWWSCVAAGVLVVGLVGCASSVSSARDGDAVPACRQAVAHKLNLPDVDGQGAGVQRVRVSQRHDEWYVQGRTAASPQTAATAFSCEVVTQDAATKDAAVVVRRLTTRA